MIPSHGLTRLMLLCGLAAMALPAADGPAAQAQAVREAAGVPAGVLVHVGRDSEGVTGALAAGGAFLAQVLDADAAWVAQARERLYTEGLHGQVSVERHAGGPLPYADNLINLLLVRSLPAQAAGGLGAQELLRVLAPRGVALLDTGAWSDADVNRYLSPGGVTATRPTAGAAWLKLVKPVPTDMDEWTHERHNPARTATSRDGLIAPARSLRWLDGPGRSRNHDTRPLGAVSAGGRFFYMFDEGKPFFGSPPEVSLVARDAFNGHVLWKIPVAVESRDYGPNARTLVASAGRLYAVLHARGPLVALDPATGKTEQTYAGSAPDEVILTDGKLLLLERSKLRCLDAASGAEQWAAAIGGYENRMAASGGRVFVMATRTSQLHGFGLADGKPLWKSEDPRWNKRNSLAGVTGETLVMATASELIGLGVADGKPLWRHPYTASGRGSSQNTFFPAGLVWAHDVGSEEGSRPDTWIGLDPVTGAVKKTFPAKFEDKCAMGKATEKYLITGRVHFFDTAAGAVDFPQIARGACSFGVVPANGLLYTFPTDCRCFPMLYGTMALSPAPVPADGTPASRHDPGPALALTPGSSLDSQDWPCFRHDSQRSGAASTTVALASKVLWETPLTKSGTLTPPVIANGKLFVASGGDQALHALDAATGKPCWRFLAGGPVVAPPTLEAGLCLVGAGDGWVYALNAEHGTLAWRYRVAPGGQRMSAFGRLSSPWPVAGGVLVDGGRVYAVAGRSGNLDGGLALCALDLKAGQPLWEQRLAKGALADWLVKGREHLFMHRLRIDPKTGNTAAWDEKTTEGALRGGVPMLGGVWANRTTWFKDEVPGQLLVFNASRVFGISSFPDQSKYTVTRPGAGDFRLFARDTAAQAADAWSVKLPLQACALTLAGETLFTSGAPDLPAGKSAQGGILWAVHAANGERRAEWKLSAPPVLDGMAAAQGRLFVATTAGSVTCLGP